jgi:hypothetical protein
MHMFYIGKLKNITYMYFGKMILIVNFVVFEHVSA